MKYIKLFEKQLDLFDGEYKQDVLKIIDKKIDIFIQRELMSKSNIVYSAFADWYDEYKKHTRYPKLEDYDKYNIAYAELFTKFVTESDKFENLHVELFKRFYNYIEDILNKSSFKLSKNKTDAVGFNIKYKDLYLMYEQHKPQEIINRFVVEYYKELFKNEPTYYKKIKLPEWLKEYFPEEERSSRANLWDFEQ